MRRRTSFPQRGELSTCKVAFNLQFTCQGAREGRVRLPSPTRCARYRPSASNLQAGRLSNDRRLPGQGRSGRGLSGTMAFWSARTAPGPRRGHLRGPTTGRPEAEPAGCSERLPRAALMAGRSLRRSILTSRKPHDPGRGGGLAGT